LSLDSGKNVRLWGSIVRKPISPVWMGDHWDASQCTYFIHPANYRHSQKVTKRNQFHWRPLDPTSTWIPSLPRKTGVSNADPSRTRSLQRGCLSNESCIAIAKEPNQERVTIDGEWHMSDRIFSRNKTQIIPFFSPFFFPQKQLGTPVQVNGHLDPYIVTQLEVQTWCICSSLNDQLPPALAQRKCHTKTWHIIMSIALWPTHLRMLCNLLGTQSNVIRSNQAWFALQLAKHTFECLNDS